MDEAANFVEPDQPPASGILQSLNGLPEILKLGGTSLLIALIIHWYTSHKKRDSSALLTNGKVESLNGKVESLGDLRDRRRECDVDINAISIKDRLKSIERPKTKKTPANNITRRNYDNLQRDKDPEEVAKESRLAAKEKERIEERRRAKFPKEDESGQRLGSTDETSSKIQLKSQSAHPGLNGYYNWHSSVTSMYRMYAIPSKSQPAVLPIHPSSERGNVPWTQTTYIGHPWTFRTGDGEENVVLKYVPFRVIPSIGGMETLRDAEGLQRFAIHDVPEDNVSRVDGQSPACVVEDLVLPEPPLLHMFDYADPLRRALSLIEMNQAILWHPVEPKYRRLRISNRRISETIYNTGGRGVLLALGFEEAYGNLECGGQVLSYDRIKHFSEAMLLVQDALRLMEGGTATATQFNLQVRMGLEEPTLDMLVE
ncbi:hypothetical protein THAOC_19681 [Thalassiosira oceanica]|uniref:Uncharacterized protein n=1 Tax=Thalassiosira oceanica TaxID=159749 RepID=K0SNL8_THAOC|nr:hypothetical protein THAOC_19681 [Thalassiosira oceanica]|eukprot:EJK60037.1 hypothetical protein THAOC_19681 [Thalassiosira oceanica]